MRRERNRGRDEKTKVGDEKKWRLEVRNDGEKIEIGDGDGLSKKKIIL